MRERVVNQSLGLLRLASVALLFGACSSSEDPVGPLPVTTTVSLAPSGTMLVNAALAGGALGFPAAAAASVEYLVVAQLTALTPGTRRSYGLTGQASLVGMPLTRLARRTPTAAEQFHGMLRAREGAAARQAALHGEGLVRAPAAVQPPPVVGSQRTFKVCANIQCNTTANVPATVQFVGQHVAIYTDNANPANGFTAGDLATLGDQFDAVLYPIVTSRFGAESDIDDSDVVAVVITKAINALIPKPECNQSYIAGYFFGGDLINNYPQGNNAEVFYSLAPDPAGSATMCTYPTEYVRDLLPVTFIHEFQHMVSFNQHVILRGGFEEVLWLNEAMSHLAEELGGLHYDSLSQTADASQFFSSNFYNAYLYLEDPASHEVITEDPPGTLEERGGQWLLLRYLVDRFGVNLPLMLNETALTGTDNVHAATGRDVDSLLGQWLLALYVSDLPGFTQTAELSYSTWDLRATFASLHQQSPGLFPRTFPLVPEQGEASATNITGSLGSGSGAFLLVTQPANGPAFSLAFRASGGGAQPSNLGPQLAVARVR